MPSTMLAAALLAALAGHGEAGVGSGIIARSPGKRGPCQGPCPISHLECGGNYGRSFRYQGRPCPPPRWEPTWALNRSTIPGPYSAFSPFLLCVFTHDPEYCAGNGLLSSVNMSR